VFQSFLRTWAGGRCITSSSQWDPFLKKFCERLLKELFKRSTTSTTKQRFLIMGFSCLRFYSTSKATWRFLLESIRCSNFKRLSTMLQNLNSLFTNLQKSISLQTWKRCLKTTKTRPKQRHRTFLISAICFSWQRQVASSYLTRSSLTQQKKDVASFIRFSNRQNQTQAVCCLWSNS